MRGELQAVVHSASEYIGHDEQHPPSSVLHEIGYGDLGQKNRENDPEGPRFRSKKGFDLNHSRTGREGGRQIENGVRNQPS